MNTLKSSKGFTLVELLMTFAIISLLTAIIFASLNLSRTKARDAKRDSEAVSLRTALLVYDLDNGGVPACYSSVCSTSGSGSTSFDNLGKALTGNASYTYTKSHESWMDTLVQKIGIPVIAQTYEYLKTLPKDPLNRGPYVYYYQTGPVTQTITDKNGLTVDIASYGSFWFISESRSSANPGYGHKRGVVVGQPDYSAYPQSGYPGGLNSIIGSSYTGGYGDFIGY